MSHEGAGKSEEALAFSFFVSNALDWGNGCYCARHAYFCFKRARREMEMLAREYDTQLIAQLVGEWMASVVVGGQLSAHRGGYSGYLAIFDDAGKTLHRKEYKKPIDYFDLVGTMSVDALTFIGDKPSDKLVAHLKQKRCRHHESIIDLGKAAFAEERSDNEFGLYKKILERDADFAEVRYWYGNQRAWQTGDWKTYGEEKMKLLPSYVVKAPLSTVSYGTARRLGVGDEYIGWIAQAEDLVGVDSQITLPANASPPSTVAAHARRV